MLVKAEKSSMTSFWRFLKDMNINEMVYFFQKFVKDICSNKIPFKVGLSPFKKTALFASLKALKN